mgnify:CR=1 FL=1
MESESTWKLILDRQLKQLSMVDGVTITAQHFDSNNPPHKIYNKGVPECHYMHGKGHQVIEFELECKAVMDCDPRKAGITNIDPYKIQPRDVKIHDRHSMVFCFPRSFPNDPIGWGFYFSEPDKVPMYSNFTCTQEINGYPFYKFSGTTLQTLFIPGIICIGAAGSDSARPMHELVENLKSYLLMEDKELFMHTSVGGNNDGGFDGRLLQHLHHNYDTLKSAIDNHQTRPSPKPTPRRRLGGDKKPRRRLGS